MRICTCMYIQIITVDTTLVSLLHNHLHELCGPDRCRHKCLTPLPCISDLLMSPGSYLEQLNTIEASSNSHHKDNVSSVPCTAWSMYNFSVMQILPYIHKHDWTYDWAELRPTIHQPPWYDSIIISWYLRHCGHVVRTAAETILVYSEYITANIQGLYNTAWVLGGGRCVRRDSSDPKYSST